MQRLLFYGMIVLIVVLLFALLDVIIYRILRLFTSKHTAQIANCIVLGVLVLIIAVSSWWGNTHTRLQVMTTHTDISSSRIPLAFDGYRIVQISDLHLDSFDKHEGREFLARMTDSIRQQKPDLIVFTGDLVTIRAVEAYPFKEQLTALAQIPDNAGNGYVPVYSILGNHDYADYMHNFSAERRQQDLDSLISLQTEAGWSVLRNTAVMLSRPGRDTDSTEQRIALIGVENIGEPPFSVYGDLELAMSKIEGDNPSENVFKILLSHNPTHWRREVLPQSDIDLTLSGHTHATQILIGGWSPAKWKYDEWMGLYSEGTQYLYVNTGIGSVGPKVRIGIAPEVSVITLRSQR